LAVLDRARNIQCVRIKFLREGDTNTKKFTQRSILFEGRILSKGLLTGKGVSLIMRRNRA
jgi:hypothetical protein